MRINLGCGFSGPDIRPGLDNRDLIIEGHRGHRIIVSAPVPVPFLWTLDFGFGTWIWDMDFGFVFGTGLGLDNFKLQ